MANEKEKDHLNTQQLNKSEKNELEELAKKFENYDSLFFYDTEKTVYGRKFRSFPFEEDEKEDLYERTGYYSRNFALHYLGTFEEFRRYKELEKKLKGETNRISLIKLGQ